ncbi:MAG TPA: P27 family phage terminase small subunit, partial [Gallionella sp.]
MRNSASMRERAIVGLLLSPGRPNPLFITPEASRCLGLPKHLLPEAKKEWKRAAAELLRYGVVSKLDRAALALYVQEWAWLVW